MSEGPPKEEETKGPRSERSPDVEPGDRVFLWACGGLFAIGLLGLILVPFADWNSIASTLSLLLSALGVVLAAIASGRRLGIPAVAAGAVALTVPIVVGVLLLRPDVDVDSFCKAKNRFDLHSSEILDDIAAGRVTRRSVVLLRNDVRAAQKVAPADIRDDLDVLADAYDTVAARLGENPSVNMILIGTTFANNEVAAATERVVAVEDDLCT